MEIRNQAAMFQKRLGTPYWVTYKFDPKLLDQPIHTTTHAGQEFDIVLKGAMKIRVGDHVETLQTGDSIYYKSSTPHGMIAADERGLTFLAMVMAGPEGDSHLGLETMSGVLSVFGRIVSSPRCESPSSPAITIARNVSPRSSAAIIPCGVEDL